MAQCGYYVGMDGQCRKAAVAKDATGKVDLCGQHKEWSDRAFARQAARDAEPKWMRDAARAERRWEGKVS